MKKTLLASMVLLTLSQGAIAEIYSCGEGCYTSNAKKGSGKADLGNKIGSYTSVKHRYEPPVEASHGSTSVATRSSYRPSGGAAPARSVPVANMQPAMPAAPKLSSARANGRRTILEQELNNERNALAQAKQNLADGRIVKGANDTNRDARIRQLESAVLDRQQNIQALQRELSRM
ncbi:hypothetical protein [Kingella bonacorsii]|uniref:Periplasmic protein n=1 Tax=Kingella bonacorsii TaxID=2796361 RepID=A0ABS1BQ37_9NEIS|nr:hypothetical protein [Kingella bonacorsii]MBK0395302.1 hypothetical protein [Kingella bonacorsii]